MLIWTNTLLSPAAAARLATGMGLHTLVRSACAEASVLSGASSDPTLRGTPGRLGSGPDIAFGQPDPADCLANPRLRWVALTTAGFARYDTDAFHEAFRARGAALTNASGVYAEPCAQHLLGMILALERQLLPSYREQLGGRRWAFAERRSHSRLLAGQTVLLLGFGAIGRSLAGLLAPFGVTLIALRRRVHSEPGVRIVPEHDLTRVLPLADHVVDVLPENETTLRYVNARRIHCFKPGARFYNVGRGSTVDQEALLEGLRSGRIGAAYLDVTEPEPLPPDHALWSAPNCYITPHSAGGRFDQDEALVDHFLSNLAAFEAQTGLRDRVI